MFDAPKGVVTQPGFAEVWLFSQTQGANRCGLQDGVGFHVVFDQGFVNIHGLREMDEVAGFEVAGRQAGFFVRIGFGGKEVAGPQPIAEGSALHPGTERLIRVTLGPHGQAMGIVGHALRVTA
ncbi:hypothetical protein DC3_12770 [Deinococcus cellulosilyticus NBRC 106333 = KACC 11606]|uniref:Uncharacterized protein n=1 Tax=Deinococcus cellulosilyticus (strain DSM 18568 / NBRC 106333 / KACC 11606 / 5516J-15) TaxID=1223518 RepID=A0A511MYP5_DEIC1|nr:hypothetical protein [Deinococcus cellulosilyticus]GEM45642.1 hypothetical protein DC3_12770 [Deinococcus cellulosilyticus NBRC 106333 = KACC 11606]